jgi:hypothetical protein
MSVNHRNLAVVLVFWGVLLSVVASVHPFDVRAQSPNQVGLVVGSGDGSMVTRCVEFAEDEISGYDLLMRSGLQVVATQSGGMGVTICEIDGEGCPADNCFCECTGSTCAYWSYWHLVGGEWSYSSVGANGHRVRPGDVDGWRWGKGDPPPVVPFEQICAPPATATSLPTATPTDTPLPPPGISFEVEPKTVVAGECAELRWQVDDVQAVYLDGQGVGGYETRTVCPTQTQTYELRVVSASSESRHSVTVNVVQPSPTPLPTDTPTLSSTGSVPLPTHTPQRADTATDAPTETWTPTSSPPKESPTPRPSATPTGTATLRAPTAVPSPTQSPPSVAVQRVTPSATSTRGTAVRPLSTVKPRQATSTVNRQDKEERSNYILFGVLVAVLLGAIVVIVLQRKR